MQLHSKQASAVSNKNGASVISNTLEIRHKPKGKMNQFSMFMHN